jgi:hypothetical protein
MAVTALKIGDTRIKFMTVPGEPITSDDGQSTKSFLQVELYTCDEEFIPQGMASRSIHEDDEETYHKKLREQASEKGHFVPEESTDYKWNPGYNPENDIDDGSESAI